MAFIGNEKHNPNIATVEEQRKFFKYSNKRVGNSVILRAEKTSAWFSKARSMQKQNFYLHISRGEAELIDGGILCSANAVTYFANENSGRLFPL